MDYAMIFCLQFYWLLVLTPPAPCTLKNETKLPESVKKHFAYAEEKLTELSELKKILSSEKLPNILPMPQYVMKREAV